jgi:acetyl-CoA C-acetyltransferase
MSHVDPRMPVLIGAGQLTVRKGETVNPRAMMKEAAGRAAADAGLAASALAGVDTLAVVGFTIDAPGTAARLPFPRYANAPAAFAEDIGATPRVAVYTHMGGNTPQALVNWAADRISRGEADFCVLVGAEYIGGLLKAAQSGGDLSVFGGGPEGPAVRWGDDRPDCSPAEQAHGLNFPANTYPIFENALRAHLRRTPEEHNRALGKLFAPFSAVAAKNPYAWFPKARSAEEIIAEGPDNRMVGYPYTKYLNAIIQVDQAACVIVASTAKADELGVAQAKRVYLHGCGEAAEVWNPIDREKLFASPAIRECGAAALEMAGKSVSDLAFFDVYSCFPVAVEVACRELGIAEDDPRGLTLTGGLPYFGGPGNNYSMHAIAEAIARCRAAPEAFGLITANGWFLTKHAMGVYSATPPKGPWRWEDPKGPQKIIDASPRARTVAEPNGPAVIESYTVVHARDSVRMGIVFGRDSEGRRFIANTPEDPAVLMDLQSREGVGRRGHVVSGEGGMKNVFTPE